MRLKRLLIGASLLAFLAAATTALAVVLSPTNFPLSGNTFQGGDGNLANPTASAGPNDPAPYPVNRDWQALAASPSLTAISDPDLNDSIYDTGSHEDKPVNWDVDTLPSGSTPAKSNLYTAWSAYESDSYLNMAFDRAVSGGNVFIAFELNQDNRSWKNASNDWIMCRTTGDLVISYGIQNNDNINIIIQRWVTDVPVAAGEAATFTNGVGCAKEGHFDDFDESSTPQLPANLVQASMNLSVSVTNYLPGSAKASFGAELFGEAAMNLGQIASTVLGTPCFSYIQFSAHGRSSESDAASLQDLVGPVPMYIGSCTVRGLKFHDVDGDGVREPGDNAISSWKVFIDADGDDQLDPGEPTALTDPNGVFVFTNLPDGSYTIRDAPAAHQPPAYQNLVCSFPANIDALCEQVATLGVGVKNVSGMDFGGTIPSGGPTAAVLRSFSASRSDRGTVVRWRTAAEAGLAGFRVYRSEGRKLVPVGKLRTARGGLAGTRYAIADGVVGKRYRLQAVGLSGSHRWLGTAVVVG